MSIAGLSNWIHVNRIRDALFNYHIPNITVCWVRARGTAVLVDTETPLKLKQVMLTCMPYYLLH